jgi:hypothetical protein
MLFRHRRSSVTGGNTRGCSKQLLAPHGCPATTPGLPLSDSACDRVSLSPLFGPGCAVGSRSGRPPQNQRLSVLLEFRHKRCRLDVQLCRQGCSTGGRDTNMAASP